MGGIILAIIFVVIAVLAAVAAIVYYTKASESLPSFMPGRRPGVIGHDTNRGLAAAIAAVAALLIAAASLGMARAGRRNPRH